MAFRYRTITGTLVNPLTGDPAVGTIKFELTKNDYTADGDVQAVMYEYTLDGSGNLPAGVTLWCNADGFTGSRYKVTEPDGAQWYFSLAYDVSSIDLYTLRSAGSPAPNTSPCYAYVNTRVVDYFLKDFSLLSEAVTAIGATRATLRVVDPFTVSENVTVPDNIQLIFDADGVLTVASGFTVTVHSLRDAGSVQIFDGDGNLYLDKNACDHINLAWWAGITNANDVTHEFEQAIQSLTNNEGGVLTIPSGTWKTTGGRFGWGIKQVESVTFTGACSTNGTAVVTITASGMNNSPLAVNVPLNTTDHATVNNVAEQVRRYLRFNETVGRFFFIGGTGDTVELKKKTSGANDATLDIAVAPSGTGITAGSSTAVTAGVAKTYSYTNGLRLPNRSIVRGTGSDSDAGGGAVIELTDDHENAFVFSHATVAYRQIEIENVGFKLPASGNGMGVVITGTVASGSGFGFRVNKCSFRDGEIGVAILDQATGWQAGQVGIKSTHFTNHSWAGIFCDCINNALNVYDSLFYVPDMKYGIFLRFVGAHTIQGCEFAGAVTGAWITNATGIDYARMPVAGGLCSIYYEGTKVAGVISGCQDEAMQYSLRFSAGNWENAPINSVGNLWQGYLHTNASIILNIIGGQICANALRDSTLGQYGAGSGTDAYFTAVGVFTLDFEPLDFGTPVGAGRKFYDFVASSKVMFATDMANNVVEVASRLHAIYDGGIFFSDPASDPWVRLGGTVNEKPLTRFVKTDANLDDEYYFDIERNNTSPIAGVFDFIANEASVKGFRFNGRFALSEQVALGTSDPQALDARNGATFTITPTGNVTINASNVIKGQRVVIRVVTSGTTSYNVTFGTNFKSQGVLATGTTDGAVFQMEFAGDADSGNLVEIGARGNAM